MASHSSPAATNSIPNATGLWKKPFPCPPCVQAATAAWKKPKPYPPCIHAANKLDPIAISHMKPETNHRGKQTTIRVNEAPVRIGYEALMTAIEDEEGILSFLQLFHQPRAQVVPVNQTLRPGGCYLIKEPLLTFSVNGAYYSLRVDHPSDILLLPDGHELLPAKWSNDNAVVGKSRDTRENGNTAVGEKRWAEAESL